MTDTNLSATLNSADLSHAAPIVSLYDLDTSAYDIDPDGRTVRIYGAAFFRTAGRRAIRAGAVPRRSA